MNYITVSEPALLQTRVYVLLSIDTIILLADQQNNFPQYFSLKFNCPEQSFAKTTDPYILCSKGVL